MAIDETEIDTDKSDPDEDGDTSPNVKNDWVGEGGKGDEDDKDEATDDKP